MLSICIRCRLQVVPFWQKKCFSLKLEPKTLKKEIYRVTYFPSRCNIPLVLAGEMWLHEVDHWYRYFTLRPNQSFQLLGQRRLYHQLLASQPMIGNLVYASKSRQHLPWTFWVTRFSNPITIHQVEPVWKWCQCLPLSLLKLPNMDPPQFDLWWHRPQSRSISKRWRHSSLFLGR